LWGNLNNAVESKIVAKRRSRERGHEEHVNEYVVKVGDVCFVAIGQIVGRSYRAVRYQASMCIVLNSPTHDAEFCRQVRSIWTAPDGRQKLFDSLLLDYATQGVFNGESLDGWGEGAELQTNAALRLLYYFPKESASLIAQRLDWLDVVGPDHGLATMHQDVTNGVRGDDFVKAVAWCPEATVRQAVFRVFQRATDVRVILNASPGVAPDHPALARDRLTRMLEHLPEGSADPFGDDGCTVLVALGKYGDGSSIEEFRKFLKSKTVLRCRALCQALRHVRKEWAAELLLPLLSDRRGTGWMHPDSSGPDPGQLEVRVCDEAAETIRMSNPVFKFDMCGTVESLERQIEAMRRAIEAGRR
jgi:hypothetical protein